MSQGIKELSELIDGLELVGKAVKKVTKDGKIGVDDLAHLVELVKQSEKLVEAVKGLDMVDDELKNLDQAEVLSLISKLYAAGKSIKEA